MSSKRVFSKLASKTHMPFFSDGTIIFCMNDVPARLRIKLGMEEQVSDYRPWHLFRADWTTKSIHQVRTGMPDNAVLCNPMFFSENNQLHISFIAGIPNDYGLQYRLYEMHGPDWDILSDPVPVADKFARTGFVSPRHFCLGGDHELHLLDKISHERFKVSTSLDSVARVTFDPQQPFRLLITGAKDGHFKTLIFDVDSQSIHEIVGPAPVYKACLVGNRVVYSHRESTDLEDFQLHVMPLELQSTSETVTIEPV